MGRMKAEKNHYLTEMVLGSEQLVYAYLLCFYLRSTTIFRMVGLVSLGLSFRYVYCHIKVIIDNLIFNQMIFNYITLISFEIKKDPLTFTNRCLRIVFKIFWHKTITHENCGGVHKRNQWQWKLYCGNGWEFITYWSRIPCHRGTNYALQPPRTKYKRNTEKELVEFFKVGSRKCQKPEESWRQYLERY
jgi:hypothetical protein